MDSFVEMTGTGTASDAPDVVALDLGVRCPGQSVAAALNDAATKLAALVDAAKTGGLADRDVQTTGASVYPQYDRDGTNVVGYVASQSLRLRVRDRARVGDLISAFSERAGNSLTIDNISLQLSDPSALLTQAREAAFADAEAKARQFALLAGRELDRVIFVADTPGGPSMALAGARMEMKDMAMRSMPVEAGESSVSVSVIVRWAWT
ncbi:MAG: SIMPL domain-containing protein [Tetrasphaera sp.]|jgi:uncharacterized protein YggE|nr:SIMPL domain-containing protein [Tetrasphaera sp.]